MTGEQTAIDPRFAASLIGWWRDAGVDLFVEEQAQPWLGRANAPAPVAEAKPEALPSTLPLFAEWLRSSIDIPEAGPAARRIASAGPAGAAIMVMIDCPEARDYELGQLLTGEVGQLFDRMLAAIGLSRETVYLAPLCPGRPATGQIGSEHLPRLGEIARAHIALVRPKRLWLLGQSTSSAILGVDAVAARGKLHFINHDGCNVETVASLHPRLLLQNPARKAGTWADMQLLMRGMNTGDQA